MPSGSFIFYTMGTVRQNNRTFTQYQLPPVLMRGWVKISSSQNTPGVSVENSVAAKSSTIEVNGDQF